MLFQLFRSRMFSFLNHTLALSSSSSSFLYFISLSLIFSRIILISMLFSTFFNFSVDMFSHPILSAQFSYFSTSSSQVNGNQTHTRKKNSFIPILLLPLFLSPYFILILFLPVYHYIGCGWVREERIQRK